MTGRLSCRSLLASGLALPLMSAVGACSEDRSRPGGGGATRITFWSALRGSQQVVDAFNRTHDRIQVDFQQIPSGGQGRYAKPQQKATNTFAYLDGGNAGWVAAPTMASRLSSAGVRNVRGFSVNVSNYYTTSQSVNYANAVNASRGYAAKFVVDTSRNGNGSNGQWCNPAGRRLGVPAQVGGGAEMLLWVKTPGNSDGQCGIAPNTPAGQFNPDLAIRLIDGT